MVHQFTEVPIAREMTLRQPRRGSSRRFSTVIGELIPRPARYDETLESSRRRTAAVVFAGFCAFLTLYAPQPLLPLLAFLRQQGSVPC